MSGIDMHVEKWPDKLQVRVPTGEELREEIKEGTYQFQHDPSTHFVPPGAQSTTSDYEERERQAQAALAAQRAQVERIQASRAALLHSPMGLRGLFPTNNIRPKLSKRPAKQGAQQ